MTKCLAPSMGKGVGMTKSLWLPKSLVNDKVAVKVGRDTTTLARNIPSPL